MSGEAEKFRKPVFEIIFISEIILVFILLLKASQVKVTASDHGINPQIGPLENYGDKCNSTSHCNITSRLICNEHGLCSCSYNDAGAGNFFYDPSLKLCMIKPNKNCDVHVHLHSRPFCVPHSRCRIRLTRFARHANCVCDEGFVVSQDGNACVPDTRAL